RSWRGCMMQRWRRWPCRTFAISCVNKEPRWSATVRPSLQPMWPPRFPSGRRSRAKPASPRNDRSEQTMSDVIIREKSEYPVRTTDQMERHLLVPPWSPRQKMALSCRILAGEGHESALAGQITTRGDRPGTYWMLSFGLGFDEACASNIVLVDDDLQLLEG